jgi:tellurite resistance protein TerC
VFVAGAGVLLLGIVMLVAPGPGVLTIMLGLGILATEFHWARRFLKRSRERSIRIVDRLFKKTHRCFAKKRHRC